MSENRLGLALSGGGFRASLFHLGVLRRLAELGLLRHVTHISTVSGGSVVAAHYYLHFKRKHQQKHGFLDDDDYIGVVKDVEAEFIRGIDADLRNSLLMNPLSHVEEFTLGNGYGRRMARLYTRHFYRSVTRDLFAKHVSPKELRAYATRGVPLHRAITRRPGQTGLGEGKSSSYPNSATPESSLIDFNAVMSEIANIPSVVMNATCLNTGGPFLFTLNEVGGTECGYVRTDEVFMLLQFKYILECIGNRSIDPNVLSDAMVKAVRLGKLLEAARPELPKTALKTIDLFPKRLQEHFYIYQAAKARQRTRVEGDFWSPRDFRFVPIDPTLRTLMDNAYWPSIRHLLEASFGQLRRAKVAAWHLLDTDGWTGKRRGGLTKEDYEAEFVRAIEDIDERLVTDFARNGTFNSEIHALILDFYYFRSAEVLDWGAYDALHEMTLSDAVAASANFPPMFAPFKVFALFEKKHVSALSLTDGGVHDNQGLEVLLDSGCTHIVVSDAGGLVLHEATADDARIPMMDRVIEVLMGGVRRVLMRSVRESVRVADLLERAGDDEDLRDLRRSTHLRKAQVIHMTSNPSDTRIKGLEPFAAMEAAGLRTDLDVFNELEIATLCHQGYQLADRYAREIRESIGVEGPVPPAVSPSPNLPPIPTTDQLRVLTAGSRRLARYSFAYPLHAAILALVVAVATLMLTIDSFDRPNGHWSSWSSLREVLDDNVVKDWLPGKRVTPGQHLDPNPLWKKAKAAKDEVIEVAEKTSLLTVIFGGWAMLLIGGAIVRALRDAARGPLKIDIAKLIGRRRRGAVFARMWNVVSMICLVLFIFTMNVKWLLGIAQLWSIPLAVVFSLVHVLFTPLWRSSGRLSPPKRRGRPFAPTGRTPATAQG